MYSESARLGGSGRVDWGVRKSRGVVLVVAVLQDLWFREWEEVKDQRHASNRASRKTSNPEFVNQMSQSVKSGLKHIIKPRTKTIFSGIQPTGIPHLGNYLGALKGWVNQQNEAEASTNLIYSLVDLHAITVKQDPERLRRWRKESLAVLLAIGLDPKRSTIFFQSHV